MPKSQAKEPFSSKLIPMDQLPQSQRSTGVYGPYLDKFLASIKEGKALEITLPEDEKKSRAAIAGFYDASRKRGLKTRQAERKLYVYKPEETKVSKG